MSTHSEIEATREQLAAVRDRMSSTAAEIDALVTERVDAVKERVNVVQVIRDHPWSSLAVALSAGVAIAASGADRKAASATVTASRNAAQAGAETVKSASRRAASATVETARTAPSRTRGAIVGALDSLAAKMAVSLIEKLREPEPLPVTPEASGLGYSDNATPATGSDSLAT
ncbi:MAG TPA: hypothetical protein VFP15_04885 [Gemmatimonadaceae bacterium]|nr:hypothetical protein [Gemmatimonadaceae bacterium]